MKQRSNIRPLAGTRAVIRAITVLKALGRSTNAYGVTELGAATGLSKATVFRLLGALENEGMVARDGSSGTYRLGPQIISLGASALSTTDLRTTSWYGLPTSPARRRRWRFSPIRRSWFSTRSKPDSSSGRPRRLAGAGRLTRLRQENFCSPSLNRRPSFPVFPSSRRERLRHARRLSASWRESGSTDTPSPSTSWSRVWWRWLRRSGITLVTSSPHSVSTHRERVSARSAAGR